MHAPDLMLTSAVRQGTLIAVYKLMLERPQ